MNVDIIVEEVKVMLGLMTNAYDYELNMLVTAAISDLKLSGVIMQEDAYVCDRLILVAITAYCQANRGTDVDKRRVYREMYLNAKRNLMLAAEYTEQQEDTL